MANQESRENRAFAYEIKFLVPTEQALELRDWARGCMRPDPNTASGAGDEYRITSLYYDTKELDVFHKRGSFGRSKYRVRRYDASPMVFLERKLRSERLVTKRRTLVNLSELERLRQDECDLKWSGAWFQRRMLVRRMNPSCQVSYKRTALVSENDSGLIRLTLDDDLRAWKSSGPEFHAVVGGSLLMRNHMILEMKFRLAMPSTFKQAIEEFRLQAQPISKYRLAVTGLGYAPPTAPLETRLLQAETAHA
ncbi:MAG: polyphosphate polymerase domain-containing protein [Candidatus Solibacter sp.]